MALTPEELRAAVEAILLVAPEPIREDELAEVFSEEGKEAVARQLEEIRRSLEERNGGFHLEHAAGGYRLATRPEQDPFLRKFFARKNEGRLSLAALETLAIVAYRQPVTSPEISDIRGVNSSGVLRTLLERRMIRIAGRKNVVGSPFLYRTTREFLIHFGLNDIRDLPKLEELADLLGENLGDDPFFGEQRDLESTTTAESESADSALAIDRGEEAAAETGADSGNDLVFDVMQSGGHDDPDAISSNSADVREDDDGGDDRSEETVEFASSDRK